MYPHPCPQENTTSDIISNLTPGAQYRVTVYHTNGPLISPPSEPVIIDIGEPYFSHFVFVFSTEMTMSLTRPPQTSATLQK